MSAKTEVKGGKTTGWDAGTASPALAINTAKPRAYINFNPTSKGYILRLKLHMSEQSLCDQITLLTNC